MLPSRGDKQATKGEQRFGAAELTLVAQVCAQLGFPCDDGDPIAATKLLTGDDPSLVDLFPELVAFRDTVFLFKLFMSPSRDALPSKRPRRHAAVARHLRDWVHQLSWPENEHVQYDYARGRLAWLHIRAYSTMAATSAWV